MRFAILTKLAAPGDPPISRDLALRFKLSRSASDATKTIADKTEENKIHLFT